MKRNLFLLLALFIVSFLLCSCNQSTPPDVSDTSADTTETEAPAADIDLVTDGVSNYTIIRPDEADQSIIDAAVLLRKNFFQYTGVLPDISTDWIKAGAQYDSSTYEILIGNTGYSESAQALEGVAYGDYIIKQVENKFVINAWCAQGLDRAITEFTKTLMSSATSGNFSLPADTKITGTAVELANQLPLYEGGTLSTVYHTGSENQMLIFANTTRDAYDQYMTALQQYGYSLYTQNEMQNNPFATYINDEYVVNAGFYPYNSEARIIIEPRSTLPGLAEENTYETLVAPSFAMIGLEHTEGSQNGLCLVWQLADGSYIIVDGGFDRSIDTRNLYKYMRTNAPDKENITVAAWIITHAHGDHHGTYFSFAEVYGKRVNVERVIANFPSDESREAGGLENDGAAGADVMRTAQNTYNAEFIKTHVGHKFFIRDAEIEILYTIESYLPRRLDYLNTASLVFSVKLGDQRFLVTADASEYACSITEQMYGNYLKSDYVTIAHHGYYGGTSSTSGIQRLYSFVAPTVVLWPVGTRDYHGSVYNRDYNLHLVNLESTKEIVVAGSQLFSVKLPYTYGTSGFDTILKYFSLY